MDSRKTTSEGNPVPSLQPLARAFGHVQGREDCVSNCNADDLREIAEYCVGGGHTSSASR